MRVRCESGQATIEWAGVVLLVSLALGALVTLAPRVDGRSFGGLLAHSIACAARGGCDDGDAALRVAYGERDAALVRLHAPNLVYEPRTLTLPVDFRECRAHRCSDAADDRDADVHRSRRGGIRATAFSRVLRRGQATYIQYWLYYPDSTTTVAGARRLWDAQPAARLAAAARRRRSSYPGFHSDDWESYHARIDAAGLVTARASSHWGYTSCKQEWRCRGHWTPATGWTRVSRGSHAGHIPLRSQLEEPTLDPRALLDAERYRYRPLYPGVDMRERTTTAAGLRLVPLETLDARAYRPLDPAVEPPWRKRVYGDPLSDSTL